MKYIKYYERYGNDPQELLVDQFTYDFIDEYYDKHYWREFDEIVELWPEVIWNHIDDERFVNDFIDNEINAFGINDLEYEYEDYLKNKVTNISEEDEKKIRKIYIKDEIDLNEYKELKKELIDANDEDKEDIQNQIDEIRSKIREIDEMDLDDIIEEMDKYQRKEAIEDIFGESEFVEEVIRDRYDRHSAEDIIKEIYGSIDKADKATTDWISNYVDERAVEKEYNENEDFDYKKETIRDSIEHTIELQEKLLEINSANALLLFDLFEKSYKGASDISRDYEFQKTYIEEYVKDEDNKYDENNKAQALKNLYDSFVLNSDIESEYKDHMYLIEIEKYNL